MTAALPEDGRCRKAGAHDPKKVSEEKAETVVAALTREGGDLAGYAEIPEGGRHRSIVTAARRGGLIVPEGTENCLGPQLTVLQRDGRTDAGPPNRWLQRGRERQGHRSEKLNGSSLPSSDGRAETRHRPAAAKRAVL